MALLESDTYISESGSGLTGEKQIRRVTCFTWCVEMYPVQQFSLSVTPFNNSQYFFLAWAQRYYTHNQHLPQPPSLHPKAASHTPSLCLTFQTALSGGLNGAKSSAMMQVSTPLFFLKFMFHFAAIRLDVWVKSWSAHERREAPMAPATLPLLPLPHCLPPCSLGSSLPAQGTRQSKSMAQNSSCAGNYSDSLGSSHPYTDLIGSVLLHVPEGCDTTEPLPSSVASVRRQGLVCSSCWLFSI